MKNSLLLILLLAASSYAQYLGDVDIPMRISPVGTMDVNCVSGCSGSSVGVTTVTFNGSAQPVSGTVAISNMFAGTTVYLVNPTTATVSGSVSVSNFPASQAVTGTFWQATQPISGTVDTELPTTAALGDADGNPTTPTVGVDNMFWSGSAWVRARGGTGDGAAATGMQNVLPMLFNGSTHDRFRGDTANGLDVDVTRVSGIVNVTPTPAIVFVTSGSISLGVSAGKANVGQTGSLVTTAATADQVVKTYTVTAGKTFYLEWYSCNARLTTFAATATYFGTCSLETPSGTKLHTNMIAGSGIGDRDFLTFPEPLPIAAGVVIRIVTTPSAVTSFTWQGNFGGYEK